MNTPNFEYDLQHLASPAPDRAARERARQAALEAFARTLATTAQATRVAADVSPLRAGSGWNARSTWWSGMAAACVAVAGVAMYWLLPAPERAVQLDQRVVVPQSAAVDAQRAPPAAAPAPAPASTSPRTGPIPRARRVQAPVKASVAAPRMDIPPAPAPPPAAASSGELSQVTVTGSRNVRRDQAFDSPVAVTTVDELPAVDALTSVDGENRDRFQHFDTNPVKLATEQPVSTFSVDVDTASYSFVRRQLNHGVLPPADAVRVEEMVNYFDYAWPVPASRQQPFAPMVAVSDSPWGKGRKLVHIGIKGYELPAARRPDVNLVLLLDVSGSMNAPDRLPLAQRSMALLLDSLKPTDTVAIVVYAGAAGQVLAPTPVREKDTILAALNSLRPGGSTAGAAGIQLAYELAEHNMRKDGVNRILLATDGDFNVGITDREQLKSYVEREREKGVYLSVLGFGEGNYRDEMAQTLAQNGNGVAVYIDTLNEARKVLLQQASAALFTIAKDVKLQVEFNPDSVAEYRLVGYESRALNREDFNNDKVDAGDVGAGHTVTAIYEITPVGSPSRMIEDRRFAEQPAIRAQRQPASSEYGFLKIRYKLPDSRRSRVLELPIRANAGVPPRLKQDVEFSAAVAGFAQLLRGGQYTGSLTFEDVLRQAQASRGEDPYGYRAEFVQLVRLAEQARGM